MSSSPTWQFTFARQGKLFKDSEWVNVGALNHITFNNINQRQYSSMRIEYAPPTQLIFFV